MYLIQFLRNEEYYFQDNLNIWDIAAGIILVKEAGGMLNHIDLSVNKNIKIICVGKKGYDILKRQFSEKITDVIEMPSMAEGKKNKKQVNSSQIFNEISSKIKNYNKSEVKVVIEHVTAMPGQGVTSMFNFGQSFGVIKGICSAMQLPMYFVRPAKWKKYFNLIKTEKEASRTKAIEIFPQISSKLSKKKDNNKADAILIASFFNNTHLSN